MNKAKQQGDRSSSQLARAEAALEAAQDKLESNAGGGDLDDFAAAVAQRDRLLSTVGELRALRSRREREREDREAAETREIARGELARLERDKVARVAALTSRAVESEDGLARDAAAIEALELEIAEAARRAGVAGLRPASLWRGAEIDPFRIARAHPAIVAAVHARMRK